MSFFSLKRTKENRLELTLSNVIVFGHLQGKAFKSVTEKWQGCNTQHVFRHPKLLTFGDHDYIWKAKTHAKLFNQKKIVCVYFLLFLFVLFLQIFIRDWPVKRDGPTKNRLVENISLWGTQLEIKKWLYSVIRPCDILLTLCFFKRLAKKCYILLSTLLEIHGPSMWLVT